MHRRRLLTGLLLLPAARALADTAIPVVASFSILADMVRRIGGERMSVASLVGPDGDVHAYEPRPSDLRKLIDARALVVNGLGLEGWMERLVQSSGFARERMVASAGIIPRLLSAHEPDPHAWQDPRNGMIYARNIADGLARADPDGLATYRDAGERYIADISATDAWIAQTLAPIPPGKRRIITSHDSFGYYAARYGITLYAAQGIDTDSEPSAQDIARLARQIRRDHIQAVFLENMANPNYVRALARDAGVVVGPQVYSDALSPPGGPADSYIAMLRHNTTLFAGAMGRNEGPD